ncbi:IS630 family transposase [Candidatus Woesearchaeota archaeon]|nr:IS630 family transposase [Candidatus Woesearchaeota archaeon]HIH38081.1 IS630 family transposase [Candidatus Woesearchaeota archaeon]HIJ04322.1 IS630 family transposase [Candidatus Woesearchaeota archaeon]
MDYEIIAIDEAGFQLTTTYKKIWFPKGETPRGAFFWSNKKLITFGALTSNHQFYYDFYDSQNSLTFRHFLRTLFERLDKKKKYVFILDNAGFHKTQCVKNLIREYAPRISVEHIPPYSPELNPIETCWKVTKDSVTKSQYFKKIDDLQTALEQFWQKHIFMQNFI